MSLTALEGAWAFFCLALPLSIAGSNIGWGLVAGALVLVAASGGSLDWTARRSPLEVPLWLFLAAAAAAALLGVAPARSLGLFSKDLHKVWLYLLFSVGLAAVAAFRDRGTQERMAGALGLGFAAAALVGVWQAFVGDGPDGVGWSRAHAFVHPVTFGNQMALGACGAFSFMASPPDRSTPRHRALATAVFCLCGAALLLSQTRGAVVAAAMGLGTLCLAHPGLRRRALWAAPLGLAAFLLADVVFTQQGRSIVGYLRQTLFQGIERTHSTPVDRFALWGAAWRMFLDHPWTGVGESNFRGLFHLYHPPIEGQSDWGTCHNLFLQHLAERGILGAGTLVLLFSAFCSRAWRRAVESPEAWNLWALSATAAFLAMNMTEVALQTEQLWMLFFFVWVWAERRHRAAGNA